MPHCQSTPLQPTSALPHRQHAHLRFMRRYTGLFFSLACGASAIVAPMPIAAIAASAPTPAPDLHAFWDTIIQSNPPEELDRDGSRAFRNLWNSIFETEPPDDPQQSGSRGDYFCLAEPGSHDGMAWSDRPTLTWQGDTRAISIYSSENPLIALWTHELSEDDQLTWVDGSKANGEDKPIYRVTYDGEEHLKPGETYIWKIQQALADIPVHITLMPSSNQQQIRIELEALEMTLAVEELDGDAIALRKADFFASHHLWNDFWYYLGLIESPSGELSNLMEGAIGTWCPAYDPSSLERV
ncbi:MAG: hypothetical protein AAGD25_11420 [Cyanobacteria bacterium P01_F01_bin.150]